MKLHELILTLKGAIVISHEEEEQLWARAITYLDRGRPGDLEHTRSVVGYGKILLANEGGDPLVVIPALILHDVGWSRVDYSDFITAPAEAKGGTESIRLHMRYGAQIARDILEGLGWNPELIHHITSIIGIHDVPEKIQELDDLDATLVFEADWLDKYAPARQDRYFSVVGDRKGLSQLRDFLDSYKSEWFRTKSAKELLVEITSRA